MLLIGTITVASPGRGQSDDGSDGTHGGTKTLIELTRERLPLIVTSATSTRRTETDELRRKVANFDGYLEITSVGHRVSIRQSKPPLIECLSLCTLFMSDDSRITSRIAKSFL